MIPVLIVGVIALVGGVGLVIASIFMAVPVDEKTQQIMDALPGANCGGCGYSGCEAYAEAIAAGEAPGNLCAPGGAATAEKVAAVTGLAVVLGVPKTAVVACLGTCDKTRVKMDYQGIQTCEAAATFFGGSAACSFGCLGYGDCVSKCVYDAIHIENGIALVNQTKCTGCTTCARICPKSIIKMVRIDQTHFVNCSSTDTPAVTAKTCKAGCIGCSRCVKVCPSGAIKVENNLAKIDHALCTSCGNCVSVCPTKVILARTGCEAAPSSTRDSDD